MKRLILYVAMFMSGVLYCQNTNVAFDSYLEKFELAFNANLEVSDYEAAISTIDQFFVEYHQLDSSYQKSYTYLLPNMAYNKACLLSLSGNKGSAIQSFKQAVDFGYNDYQHALIDSDLDTIRDEEEFILVLNSMKETGDYLYILKKDAGYSDVQTAGIPDFLYEDKNHERLKELRATYNLDSIAGSGDEFSKQANLMKWVHNRIPHDGNKENPKKRNSLDLIEVCTSENRGLNCRGLAIVLNDAYLAMGYKSRFLTCLPKDLNDFDCHVINIVYSETYDKWLWMDPTNEAYVKDEKGIPLSVEEVREKLINDKPLVLNPEANWNHKEAVTADDYLYRYMAKNLYSFEIPIENTFDLESPGKNSKNLYLRLYPEGYNPDEKETNTVLFKTNNPEQFWKVN